MKKIKSLTVFILLFVISVLSVFALVGCNKSDPSSGSSSEPPVVNNKPIDNLEFEEQNDGTYGVKTSNKNIEGALVIPAEYNGKAVTIVLQDGFNYCTKLTSVEIPNGVKIIDKGAFETCYGLSSVTIYPSITEIRVEAFRDCGEFDLIHKGNQLDFDYWTASGTFLNSTVNRIYQSVEKK